MRANRELTDPTRRVLTRCELGYISILTAATLRSLGFIPSRRARWRHEGLARSWLYGSVRFLAKLVKTAAEQKVYLNHRVIRLLGQLRRIARRAVKPGSGLDTRA
jgi:hypothetical protein